MRQLLALVVLLAGTVARAGTAPPGCTTSDYWTQSWTNPEGDLTFELTAPCQVIFDTDFVITAEVHDTTYTSGANTAAFSWKITDTPLDPPGATTVKLAGSFWLDTVDGNWLTTVQQRYSTGLPVDHRILFSYNARTADNNLSAHFWAASVVGTTTYDPYAPTTTDPTPPTTTDPTPPTTTDPAPATTTDPGSGGDGSSGGTPTTTPTPTTGAVAGSGGCGSSGVTPALIGLGLLAAAACPRRRARQR